MPDAGLILTTSWDDGHPLDRRLAELLLRHGVAATFYVPIRNAGGRPVMTAAEVRALADAGFEVASHTLDHRRLPGLSRDEARRQMIEGRERLQDLLGRPVGGFCYPGGHPGRWGNALAREVGFAYARTTQMLCLDPGSDPFAMPTTAQIHPHHRTALLRNWLRHGGGGNRLEPLWALTGGPERTGGGAPRTGMERLLALAVRRGGTLHLWGHSWEIHKSDLWAMLDDVLAAAAALSTQRLTNHALALQEMKA